MDGPLEADAACNQLLLLLFTSSGGRAADHTVCLSPATCRVELGTKLHVPQIEVPRDVMSTEVKAAAACDQGSPTPAVPPAKAGGEAALLSTPPGVAIEVPYQAVMPSSEPPATLPQPNAPDAHAVLFNEPHEHPLTLPSSLMPQPSQPHEHTLISACVTEDVALPVTVARAEKRRSNAALLAALAAVCLASVIRLLRTELGLCKRFKSDE